MKTHVRAESGGRQLSLDANSAFPYRDDITRRENVCSRLPMHKDDAGAQAGVETAETGPAVAPDATAWAICGMDIGKTSIALACG